MKKFLLVFIVSFSLSCVHAENGVTPERLENLVDFIMHTGVAYAGSNLTQNPLSMPASMIYGVGAWGSGEVLEMFYKKMYQHHSGRNLRQLLGSSELCGIEIDRQRLIRRTISLALLGIALHARK